MKPRIVFLLMSAVAKPGTVDQLAAALAPHVVLVHHDFSQTPAFSLTAPNVRFVPEPKRTGWAHFGFIEGIFHSLQYALDHLDFDYLQLLSPTCLPIKPMAQFEQRVSGPEDAHFECIDLFSDRDALMSVGYRALTPERSLRHRVARRLSGAYFGDAEGRRDEAGIWLHSGGGEGVLPRLALLAIKALSHAPLGRHIFDKSFRPYYGSVWFGARPQIVARMVSGFVRPGVTEYFSHLRIAEEFLIPTLLMHVGASRGPMSHYVRQFNQAHPTVIEPGDIEALRVCPYYFARKFPDDPDAPVRLRVLEELASTAVSEVLIAKAGGADTDDPNRAGSIGLLEPSAELSRDSPVRLGPRHSVPGQQMHLAAQGSVLRGGA